MEHFERGFRPEERWGKALNQELQDSCRMQGRGAREYRKEIIKIAWPAILESLVNVIVTSIDTRMISPLGKSAVSAVSLTSQPKLFFFSIFFALGTAGSIFVSQALGKRDAERANRYFHAVLRTGFFLSVVMGVLFYFLADPIMRLCSRQTETIDTSVAFFRIIMCFMVFQTVSIILNAALRGIGKTRVTFISGIFMAVGDIVVNYLLIEGHFGFPALGVIGDAIGTVAGSAAACAFSIFYLIRHSDFLSLKGLMNIRELPPEYRKDIRSKAGNIVLENLFTRIGFLLSSFVVSGLPADRTSVYFVAMILLNYTFAFGDGLQSAVVTLTGRSVGAGQLEEGKTYFKQICLISCVISGILSLVYIFGARWYYGIFFADPNAVSEGAGYNYVVAALTVLQILRIVIVGAMRGTGETKIPRTMALLCVLFINPPLSFLLAEWMGIGVWGIWYAILITQTVWFVMSLVWGRKCLNRIQEGRQDG